MNPMVYYANRQFQRTQLLYWAPQDLHIEDQPFGLCQISLG